MCYLVSPSTKFAYKSLFWKALERETINDKPQNKPNLETLTRKTSSETKRSVQELNWRGKTIWSYLSQVCDCLSEQHKWSRYTGVLSFAQGPSYLDMK